MGKVLEFKAVGKTTVTLDGNFLRVKRKGFLNFANHGMDGEKTFDINNITGVQMKKAGAFTNGYLQFILIGSRESKGGLLAATKDENTIMFAKKEQKMADEIKAYVENIIANKGNAPTQKIDGADELRKYKSLLDDGIITEEEFQVKKKQILDI